MSTIHERFRLARESLNLSQEAFANKAHRSRSEIKNIEYAKTFPKDDVINAIAAAHGISVTWLTTGEGPMMMPPIDESVEYIDILLKNSDNPFVDIIRKIMVVYDSASPEDQAAIMRFAKSIMEQK